MTRLIAWFTGTAPARRRVLPGVLSLALLLVFLAAAAPSAAAGGTAEDVYHAAANLYVAGKIQEASVEAEEGLRLHPGDSRLRLLAEHLRKMKDEQRGGGSGEGDGKNDDKSDRDGDKNQDGKNDRDGKDGPNDPERPDDRSDEGKNDPQEGAGDGERDGERTPEDRSRDGASARGPRMSEEEAKRLLNSFADDEKKEQAERRKAIRARPGTEQDW